MCSAQHFTFLHIPGRRGSDFAAGKPSTDRYTAATIHDLDRRMSWIDLYLVVLFLALVGLLVAKFRG
jgi:hypothetical protein